MENPNNMPPQAAPEEQEQGGGAKELLSNIHSSLVQLIDSLQKAGLEPESAKFGSILQAFQAAVEGLGQPQGAPDAQPQGVPLKGNVPLESGMQAVRPAL